MADLPIRPPTPQTMVHRLPDKPEPSSGENIKPSKFIVLITASLAVAGKVQVAKAVSAGLECPLFQGDSLHETAAKAASVGADAGEMNETRYQRMWLSKMTRTGLLFPEESRAAGAGFSGFGGRSSVTSRRGSESSMASEGGASSVVSGSSSLASSVAQASQPTAYMNKPPLAAGESGSLLMVLTHPQLEGWQKGRIRSAVGDYGIGVIFIPLDEDDLPVLQPLDPSKRTSFGNMIGFARARDWSEEISLTVDTDAMVEELAHEVVDGVHGILSE